ncbi:hypothetical protein PX554_22650 [Sphingomonas sp. H39-1-10]|uniref:hypothetical protein n=1 Tax=Sphingomonas pollutisoli TaxID=3030829 RepID=UPI0023B88AD5|nr:hypothetical protein [Sphingomonas pollutisoli]MDF0490933.1 hypothetical protein [Sphingomonas pollutisoli]
MRRTYTLAVLAFLIALSGCGGGESKQDQIDRLEGEVSSLRDQIDKARTDAQALSDDVDRFDSEDWKDVVGDVKDKRDAVVSDLADS